MKKGRIIKGIGGFYYVKTEKEDIIECRARGIFRKDDQKPLVGDFVNIELIDGNVGTVCEILPRKNNFLRPPIANVDTLIIVASVKNPKPDFIFIDKMTVVAKKNNANPVICLNKSDLSSNDEIDFIKSVYKNTGYKIIVTSAQNKLGLTDLENVLKNKVSAFTGFSGVGKSSILNVLNDYGLETGQISQKLNRGRHTTRHVELFEYKENSYVADTPGFSMLDLPNMPCDELADCFPEMLNLEENCKFIGCSHVGEPDCGVKKAVENGLISDVRYNSYVMFYNALKEKKEWER